MPAVADDPTEDWFASKSDDWRDGAATVFHSANVEVARLEAVIFRLQNALEAALVFYQPEWAEARAARWRELTGADECSTRTLCDFIRATLEETEG